MLYKRILGSAFIISTVLVINVSAFTIRLFSPGFDMNAGGTSMFVFEGDTPALVTVKIAVQNQDNTLTAIESLSAPNITPGDFVMINIPKSVEPGINYWFIAVDMSNESNYATLGPRVIRKMFDSNNPTASITADSGTTYKTDAGFVSATKTNTRVTPTGPLNFPTQMFPNGVYPTGTSNSKETSLDTHDHGPAISMGAIIGIALGCLALFGIVIFSLYFYCLRKAVKTLTPVVDSFTRPTNMRNRASIPIASTHSTAVNRANNHKLSVSPTVTLAKPQNQKTPVKPSPKIPPSSPVSTSDKTEYTFSASKENVYNSQYPGVTHIQQSYPPYPYPYNSNAPPQGLPYPSQELMPMPEHFNGGMQPYPPLSPTIQANTTYPFQTQQQYFNYVNQQNREMQHREISAVSGAYETVISHPIRSEHVEIPISSTVYDQKVEHDHPMSDKVEYNQKPDDASAYNKPNSITVQQYHKPLEREI